MIDDILLEAEETMEGALDNLSREFSKVRTGRANPAMLDGVKVDYYGVPTAISQIGNISVPEGNQLLVKPYDKSMIKEVEKAILASNLGINPTNEGEHIRIVLPQLNEERRKTLVRDVKKLAENAKVAIRNGRRDANDAIKKLEKSGDLTEDDAAGYLEDVQTLTDQYTEKVSESLAKKEKELLAI